MVVALALACAACGHESDHTAGFVACVSETGGTVVTRPAQLANLEWDDAESGGGIALDHLTYSLIDLPTAGRMVAVLFPPGLREDHLTDEDLERAVRADPRQFRAVVLTRPLADSSQQIEDCREQVAPGEILP